MKFDDRKLRQIEKTIAQLGRMEARVGVVGAQANAEHDRGFTMAELAYVHEFGSPAAGVPERSFIRSAFDGQGYVIKALAAKVADAVIEGRTTPEKGVALMGEWGVARVRENMTRGIAPPLAPATLEKRRRIQRGKVGIDKPLIDTGRLRQAVTYEVGDKK